MGVTASAVGREWKWRCRFYYNDTRKHPLTGESMEGQLAIETVHKSDHGKDMEVAAGEARDDIGRIEVDQLWA